MVLLHGLNCRYRKRDRGNLYEDERSDGFFLAIETGFPRIQAAAAGSNVLVSAATGIRLWNYSRRGLFFFFLESRRKQKHQEPCVLFTYSLFIIRLVLRDVSRSLRILNGNFIKFECTSKVVVNVTNFSWKRCLKQCSYDKMAKR